MTLKLAALCLWIIALLAIAPLLFSSRLMRAMWLPDALVAATLLAGIATIWAVIL